MILHGSEFKGSKIKASDGLIGTITDMPFDLHSSDGEITHIADFLIEDADWSIHYLKVDIRNWRPGKHVPISPRSIVSTDRPSRLVNLDISREKLERAPAHDGSKAADRAYEYAFRGHYDGKYVVEPA